MVTNRATWKWQQQQHPGARPFKGPLGRITGQARPAHQAEPSVGLVSGGGGNLAPGLYRLIAIHSNKCFDVSGVSRNNGAIIHQWKCNNGGNQKWTLSYNGGDAMLTAQHSNLVASVHNASTLNGVDFVQWSNQNGAHQKFRITFSNGGYKIVNVKSGKCVDVSGAGKHNGARIVQVICIILNLK